VEIGRFLDHLPILLQIEKDDEKPTIPFKFNLMSLKEEIFIKLLKVEWRPFQENSENKEMLQLANNLKRV
jgi:hypothetical protein